MPDYAKYLDSAIPLEVKIEGMMHSLINENSQQFMKILKEEVPVRSGALRDSIRIIPANKRAGRTVATVVVGATGKAKAYAWEILKGATERYIFPREDSGNRFLKFQDWERGPQKLRSKGGFFFFPFVFHPRKYGNKPNNFIERANKRFRETLPMTVRRKFRQFKLG